MSSPPMLLLLLMTAVAVACASCRNGFDNDFACSLDDNVTVPDSVRTLLVEHADVDAGLFESLQDKVNLTVLKIRHVSFVDLCNYSVVGLEVLNVLDFSESDLNCVPRFNLTSLQVLLLQDNSVKAIGEGQFCNLRSLQTLNLSGNAIADLSSGGFLELDVLKQLDLSRNNLTTLPNDVFAPLKSLRYLNLSNNALEILNEACFASLLRLQQLDVSWNRLARVSIGSLQLPSLARLLLAGNPDLGEPTLFVGTGRRLQTVDASRTGLKQVPAALTHSIRTLRLAGNAIRTVRCGDLDSYPLLQLLDFSANKLTEIEEDALGRLDSLTVLYLTDNKLSGIPHSLPERLRVLHLESNQVGTVDATDLQGLPQLEALFLQNNLIKNIDNGAFSQLVSLSSLDLSHNPVGELPMGSLAGPVELRVLRLAGLSAIQIAKEVEFPLSNPEHLITLDIANSPGLARQMLADTAALAASRELQELNLSGGDIDAIRSDLLHYLPQLRLLHIYDNPLNCSGMQWLAEWMRKEDEPLHRRATCASPPELSNVLLVDIQSIESESLTEPSTKAINHTTAITFTTATEENITVGSRLERINSTPERASEVRRENGTAAVMSMYSSSSSGGGIDEATTAYETLTHPGLLIAALGVLLVALVAAVLTVKLRQRRTSIAEDIEVSSLSSVTELW